MNEIERRITGRPVKFDRRKQVQWLLAYRECGSITRAAALCNVSYGAVRKALSEEKWLAEEKEAVDYARVETVKDAVFKRAEGFEFDEVRTEDVMVEGRKVPNAKKVTVTKKYLPPDVEACKFVLKNKMPEEFKDKQETDINLRTFEHFRTQQGKYGIGAPKPEPEAEK